MVDCKYKTSSSCCLKKNQNARRQTRPSEHPPVRGKKMSKRLGGIIGCNIQRIGCQPEKLLYTGGQSRSGSAEQGKKEKEKIWQRSWRLLYIRCFFKNRIDLPVDVYPSVLCRCSTHNPAAILQRGSSAGGVNLRVRVRAQPEAQGVIRSIKRISSLELCLTSHERQH